jgi:S1-C subfamily serine protease
VTASLRGTPTESVVLKIEEPIAVNDETDQMPDTNPTFDETQTGWPGAIHGMPAPPGWGQPSWTQPASPSPAGWAPRPDQPAPKRPSRWVPVLVAVALVASLVVGGITALSMSNGSTGGQPGAGAEVGIVNVTTFGKQIGAPTTQLTPMGAGTGMVLTSDGEVLTNNHVVKGAWKIQVRVPGSSSYTATVVGVDPAHDVALIQLQDASGLSTISPGDSSSVTVGENVAGIGNALGRGGSPTVANGAVTGLNRSITANDPDGTSERLTGMIQTNAHIQPGDSGGGLVDPDGQVIGMITAGSDTQTTSASQASVGFAIPISTALEIVDQIHAGGGGSVLMGERGYLGVGVRGLDSDPNTAAQLGVQSGALVVGVEPNGPAAGAGMTTPAVITGVDGKQVTSPNTLGPLLHAHVPGESAQITWVDNTGTTHTATVQLISGPAV